MEHSRAGLDAACASRALYLEVDTRVSRDGRIYVSHDDSTARFSDECIPFTRSDSGVLDRIRTRSGAGLLTLRETLEVFRARTHPDQRLAIDVKDYGFEEAHFELVRELGLEDRTTFVSWIPQTLTRLRALGARTPLVLSYWSLLRLGAGGALATRFLRQRLFRVAQFVAMGRERVGSDLGDLARGFQHGLFCQELPDPLAETLSSSGGGICVHRSMVCDRLGAWCRSAGLQLWVFSVQTPEDFRRYAALEHVDVVFSDDASNALGRAWVEPDTTAR